MTVLKPEFTPAPDRRFRDLFSPTASRDADRLRDIFLKIGLAALTSDDPHALTLPPVAASRAKQSASRKDLHRHRFVEVGIVTRGEMTIWWDGVTCRFPTGSVFVIPPGMRYLPHATLHGEEQHPHSVVWLALHRGCAIVHMCSLEGDSHHLGEYFSFTDGQVTAQSRSIAQELAERSAHHSTVIRGCLLCLLTWLSRAPVHPISRLSEVERDQTDVGQDSFSERVQSYLSSHYHRPVTLAQVARSIGCSPAYLCRHFRELTGQTPFQYLREVRIEAAKHLLQSDVPITRVAEMVGFDDPLYFSRVFSNYTGESAQTFRGKCRGES